MTNEQYLMIRERYLKATPGPWRWFVEDHDVKLLTTHSGRYWVMGFTRMGMHQAQPVFQVYEQYQGPVNQRGSQGMVKATELRCVDRYDIDHPDAQLISHAPEDIGLLLAEVEKCRQLMWDIQRALDDTDSAFPTEDRIRALLEETTEVPHD